MDIVTHILTAGVTANFAEKNLDIPKWPIYLFGIIPDIGELLIQKALNKKHNAVFGVYDLRTSDEGIASNLNVTWVYDFMHSFLVLSFIFLIYFLFAIYHP